MSIKLPTDAANTGQKVDTTELTVNGELVVREIVRVGGGGSSEVADIRSTTPNAGDNGLVTRSPQWPAALSAGSNFKVSLSEDNIALISNLTTLIGKLPAALTGSGNLKVCINEDTVGSTVDTDDGSVASAQTNVALVITEPYVFDGANWVRGGWTPYKLNSAASTNGTNVKASAGTLGMVIVFNTNAAVRYLKLYNKATAPTVGTDTPVQTYAIPGATTGAGFVIPLGPAGLNFSTGIGFGLTTGATDADTGAVAANEITVNFGYR